MDPTLRTLVPSFRRYLLATNRSARTVQTYLCALDGLTRYLESESLPLEVQAIRRSHLGGVRRGPAGHGQGRDDLRSVPGLAAVLPMGRV